MSEEKLILKIATRSSQLALWQAHHVQARLLAAGWQSELITFETIGDRVTDRNPAELGSKGIFTAELQEALRDGSVHLAVHSAKDLPGATEPGMQLIAFTERAETHDVLVSFKPIAYQKDRLNIGTSSARRMAQLRRYYPHLTAVPMRGNLNTRRRKLEEGQADALLLAAAGVARLGWHDVLITPLPLEHFTPAPGQGTLAIEVAEGLDEALKTVIRTTLNHSDTEACVLAERAFLATLGGGCSVPVFAHATLQGERLHLKAGVCSVDGSTILEENVLCTVTKGREQAVALALRLKEKGALRLLQSGRP